MPKASPIQEAFNAGEFSPLMDARVRFDKYGSALRTCLNAVPIVEGGVTARPGTKFVAAVKDSSKATRLLPFEFSTTQAYVLEFGDLYMRVHKDHGQVTNTATVITGITQANPGVVTAAAHGLSNGDRVVITGVAGMTQVNNREFTVAGATANTFQLSGVNTTGYDAYSSGGQVAEIYELVLPYVEADLFEIKVAQSADTLYVTHPGYAPRKITRTAHNNWTVAVISFQDGPYLPLNTTATTLTPSATTGAVTITASAATFASTDVGRVVRIRSSGTWGWATITAFTSATQVTATVGSAFGSTAAVTNWRLGVWSGTTGYPAAVTFYEDRLVFGGAPAAPQRIDGSNTGEYENFAPTAADGTVAASNAVSFTLNSSDVNVIRWLVDDEKGLLVGTTKGEWIVRPSTSSEALSATNVSAKRSTNNGCADIQPARTTKAPVYVQRSGRKLRSLTYVFELDGFHSPNLTRYASHVSESGIKEMDFQQEPHPVLWCVRNDGVVAGLTVDPDENVLGWHRQIFGGAFGSGDAMAESVASIPTPDGTSEEAWFIVKRTVNGNTVRYIEYLTPFWDGTLAQDQAFFVDCGLSYDGSPVSTLSGLFHLEGQTVAVLADGAVHPDVTVASGKVTLARSASVVHVGLAYDSDVETLRLEAGAADGTAQGKTKRIHSVVLRLFDTLGVKQGPSTDKLSPIYFRTASDEMSAAVPLFTGDIGVPFEGDYDSEGRVFVRRYQPLPMTLLAIMPQVSTQDDGQRRGRG